MPNFTKKAIKSTFIDLLNKKPLNQITVKMIVEECGINRNSFYYHYQDLPALIEEIITEEAERIITEYPTINSIETAMTAVIDFASTNRRAILHIYNSLSRDIFERYLWRVCSYVVDTYGRTLTSGKQVNPQDIEIIRHIYKCECFGLVIDWLNNQMTSDVQGQIHRFCTLCRGMTETMIERSMEDAEIG